MAKGLVPLGEAMSRAMQDGQVIVESSDKMWPIGARNGKPLQYFCYKNPINSTRRQKDMTLKDKSPHPQVGRCLICYWGRKEDNY